MRRHQRLQAPAVVGVLVFLGGVGVEQARPAAHTVDAFASRRGGGDHQPALRPQVAGYLFQQPARTGQVFDESYHQHGIELLPIDGQRFPIHVAHVELVLWKLLALTGDQDRVIVDGCHAVAIQVDYLLRGSEPAHLAVLQPKGVVAQLAHRVQTVRHENDRDVASSQLADLVQALHRHFI